MLVIVMGDINLNLLNPENLNYINAFINNMLELNMHPAITRPTRITLVNQSLGFSLLDQIWTTTRADPTRSFILPMSITDHFPVGIIIENVNQTSNISREIERRVFSERNKETFKTLLNSIKLLANFNSIFSNYYRSFILPMSITGHFPVGIIIENVNQTSNISREIERRVFSERNKETFKTLLNSIKLLANSDHFNCVFSNYYRELFLTYNNHSR